jgi:hypothetical protein
VVKYKHIFAALGLAVLALSLVGCGAFKGQTNDLQSVQISTSNTAESAPGTLSLEGEGGTLQLYAWGNYTSGVPKLLNDVPITYQISITPGSIAWTGPLEPEMGDPNANPPQSVQLSSTTGLLTAIPPFECTFVNTATSGTSPAWAIDGSYAVTATYKGMTSPPVFVAVASAAGRFSTSNPNSLCGPQAGS